MPAEKNPGDTDTLIDTWIFDLDNTLYPATTNLFPQIDRRMRAYVAHRLKLTLDDAFILQKRYYREFGTTLRGLMINHDIEPEAFLDYVHDIDHSVLTPDTRLAGVLAALPGRKFVYTNGTERHAASVMDRLGVSKHFSGVFDISASRYVPKPDPAPYAELVTRHGIAARRAAMFEDIHLNLKPAHALGMTTVLIRNGEQPGAAGEDLSHCHFVTDDLAGWLETRLPKRT